MSHSSLPSSFQALFNAALEDYTNKTGTKLLGHPLAKELDKCDSVGSISALLQAQAREFNEFRGEDGKIMKSLKGVIHVLYTLSTRPVLGEGVGLVCPKSLISTLSLPDTHPIEIFTVKCSICCVRSPAWCRNLTPLPSTYSCDTFLEQAVKDVSASYDALVDLFESIERFLKRLDIYTKIELTTPMIGILVKIMSEILSALALATKQVKRGRLSESCSR